MERRLSNFTGNHGRIWIQPDGPNTAPVYLGCHDVSTVTEPKGAVSRTHCPSRKSYGQWIVAARKQAPPDEITTTITTVIEQAAGYLEEVVCPVPIYIHQSMCGTPDLFFDYNRGQVLQESYITQVSDDNLVQREGNDDATQAFDISAAIRERYWKLALARQTTTEANGANDVAFLMTQQCAGPCGPVKTPCSVGFVVYDAGTDAVANVEYTTDGGTTWTATAANPFVTDEAIISVVVFPIEDEGVRALVARGSTDAGNAAEVAYTDDYGTNWTLVDLDTADGDYVPHQGGLFYLDYNNIWCVTNDGECHKSEDGGVSWTEQDTGKATALNMVKFIDKKHGIIVGASNVVLFTEDGGLHWQDIGGPADQAGVAANCCAMVREKYWFVGYADGELWYTPDGGTNWYERAVSTPSGHVSTDAINDLDAIDLYCLFMAVDWTDGDTHDRGAVHRSINGGYDWEVYSIDTEFDSDGSPGLQALWPCDYNKVFAVGDPIDSTAAIYIAVD